VLLGMAVAILVTTVAFAVPAILAHRQLGDRLTLRSLPGSLIVGAVCVLVSRVTSFEPGYLYGLLIGVSFAREMTDAQEGRITALSAALMLVVALAAWWALSLTGETSSDLVGVAVATLLAATMVAGLEAVFFGLMPVRFLPGATLFGWSRVVWAALLGIGAFAFFHVLINPASGYLSDSSRVPFFTTIALLAGFGLVSVLFWASFRFRPAKAPPAPEEA
jgi:hypothetical protein